MRPLRYILSFCFLFSSFWALGQQDVDFYVTDSFLSGVKIIKVYQNAMSPIVFVLDDNNRVYQINVNTKTLTDISQDFAPYNNAFKFIDIVSPDDREIFVATNTSNLIDFKNNTSTLIGAASGIQGNIRSIGYQAVGGPFQNYQPFLLIGTDVGIGLYSLNSLTVKFTIIPYPVDIFVSDFRTCIYTYFELENNPGSRGIIMQFFEGDSGGYIWDGPGFGSTNTAFNDFPDLTFDYANEPDLINFYWGSNKGLYESPLLQTFNTSYITKYLTGIPVNKICNILGLTSFGNKYFKSNLLVGTTQGLYFSNSTISPTKSQVTLNFTHLDLLGNININDIHTSINNVTHLYNLDDCENEVWLATDNGLYGIKPDYAKYFNVKQVNAITFPSLPDTTSTVRMCSNDSIAASINYNFIYGNTIQWFRDSIPIQGATNQNLVIRDSGNYYAVLYNSCENIHEQTNQLSVKLIAPVVSFNYPDTVRFCADSALTLTASGSNTYKYRWYKNDTLTSVTSPSLAVTATGNYKVEISSCPNTWVSSTEVYAQLVKLPQPNVTSAQQMYCAEDTALLYASVPVNSVYTINWYKNDTLIVSGTNLSSIKVNASGTYRAIVKSNFSSCLQSSSPDTITFIPAPVFSFNYPDRLQYCAGTPITLTAGSTGAYKYRWYENNNLLQDTTATLQVTQSGNYQFQASSCSGSWTRSKIVAVNLIQLSVPVITFDKAVYCIGDMASLTESVEPDSNYTINWYKDGVLLPTYKDQKSINTNVAGNYTVTVNYNSANTDGSVCSQKSTAGNLSFSTNPQVSIQENVNTTLCAGQTVYLTAQHTPGTVQWSTGKNTDEIAVTAPGVYQVTVTSPAGCTADTSIAIAFLPDPVLSLHDTSVCSYKKQVVTLTAPPGFQTYEWNGQIGTETFEVLTPQVVTLTVTDTNGCEATQQIKVVDQCPDVYIPNTFTPNGDGINDTWAIQGLEGDQSAYVRVFTRYGAQVYESHGYGTPWDGRFAGKKLPTGVYYYIITAKNNTEKFSGSLTIVY